MEQLDSISIERIIEMSEENAQQFRRDGVKVNQIRNFYSSISRLKS